VWEAACESYEAGKDLIMRLNQTIILNKMQSASQRSFGPDMLLTLVRNRYPFKPTAGASDITRYCPRQSR